MLPLLTICRTVITTVSITYCRLYKFCLMSNHHIRQDIMLSTSTTCTALAILIIFSAAAASTASTTCPDYRITSHTFNKTPQPGLPMPTADGVEFVSVPPSIGACGLAELHRFCVEQLNLYRSGALGFKDGSVDSNVAAGLKPLRELHSNNECSSRAAMGDLVLSYERGGGCKGAHANAFTCPRTDKAGQNSCCARGDGSWGKWDRQSHDTVDKVKREMNLCFKTMWNEGIKDGQKGHWRKMRSINYSHVSCGFAWSTKGRVLMTQDFTAGAPKGSSSDCSCKGKSAGKSDGCGNKCISSSSSSHSSSSSSSNNNNNNKDTADVVSANTTPTAAAATDVTSSTATAQSKGAWYCRVPGKKVGSFTQAKCLQSCTSEGAHFIETRCCPASKSRCRYSVASRSNVACEKLQQPKCH